MTDRTDPPVLWALLQIAALSLHMPLGLMTGSQRALASVSGVVIVSLGTATVFTGLYFLIRRIVGSGWRALALVSVAIVLFWHGSSPAGLTGVLGWTSSLILAALVFTAAYRFAERRLFKLATFVGAMTMAITLIVLTVVDTVTTPEPVVGATSVIPDISLTSTPDIYLVLLDGYGRADVLDDLYSYDNSSFMDDLRASGFDVAPSSSSNYTITHLSLPSLLEMSYMNEPLDYMNNSDLQALARVTSGDNTLVRTLKDAGYTYVHGDSDHWFNTCGPSVDVCLPGPLLDVTGHTLLATTPVGDLFYPVSGDPTTALNRTRIDEMTSWSDVRPQTDDPVFAFLHLVLPHPPLFLDRECAVRVDPELGGRILNDGRIDEAHLQRRKDAWVEQLECANKTVFEFLGQIDDEAVVVLTSDHGPDSAFVIESADPEDLTTDLLRERLPTLTAVRMPESCRGTLPEDIHTVNLFRRVLGCLSDTELDMLDSRYFAASFGGSIVELDYANELAD